MPSVSSVTKGKIIDDRFQSIESAFVPTTSNSLTDKMNPLPSQLGSYSITEKMNPIKGYHNRKPLLSYRAITSATTSINKALPRQPAVTSHPVGKPRFPGRSRSAIGLISLDRSSRRFSTPDVLEVEKNSMALTSLSSGSLFKHRGKMNRRNSLDSVDRELSCMYKNSVEERRLKSQMMELDRRSVAGSIELKHQQRELLKQHSSTIQRSPSADQWLTMRKSRTTSWQARERDDIAKRYSRRLRQFRAPPHLQQTVAKVRTLALLEAGLCSYNPQARRNTQTYSESEQYDDDEEELLSKLTSLNIARRHTIADRAIADNLPPELRPESTRFRHIERRMTMDDIQNIKGILDFQANQDLADLHSFSDEEAEYNKENDNNGKVHQNIGIESKNTGSKQAPGDSVKEEDENKTEVEENDAQKQLSNSDKIDSKGKTGHEPAGEESDDSFDEEIDLITDENWDCL